MVNTVNARSQGHRVKRYDISRLLSAIEQVQAQPGTIY